MGWTTWPPTPGYRNAGTLPYEAQIFLRILVARHPAHAERIDTKRWPGPAIMAGTRSLEDGLRALWQPTNFSMVHASDFRSSNQWPPPGAKLAAEGASEALIAFARWAHAENRPDVIKRILTSLDDARADFHSSCFPEILEECLLGGPAPEGFETIAWVEKFMRRGHCDRAGVRSIRGCIARVDPDVLYHYFENVDPAERAFLDELMLFARTLDLPVRSRPARNRGL
jgi:hypothetical protein